MNFEPAKLNSEQLQAVNTLAGPVLIIAGAGAGKTKTLVSRIVNLIDHGTRPNNILGLTFTNKAAGEMFSRIDSSLREKHIPERPWLGTFHSLGTKILRDNGYKFNIADRNDSIRYIKRALKQAGYENNQCDPKSVLATISRYKADGFSLNDFQKAFGDGQIKGFWEKLMSQIWPQYEKILMTENNLDFDDLLLKTRNLLSENDRLRKKYQNRWSHIHIDEYQDTNKIQYQLTHLLTNPQNPNICVVGDIDQSIYGWRGADMRNIIQFSKDFPETKTIILEKNYRSTANILYLADKIISVNKNRINKINKAHKDDGEPVKLLSAWSENDEAEKIITEIKKLLQQGLDPNDIAILYRLNFQSRALEEAFLKAGLPYKVIGVKFFQRAEIKDLLSYIISALDRENWSNLKRALSFLPEIGKVTIAKIASGEVEKLPPITQNKIKKFYNLLDKIEKLVEKESPKEVLNKVFSLSGLADKWRQEGEEGLEKIANIKELLVVASKYKNPGEEEMIKLLDEVALASDQDEISAGGVRLMTVHASKGLEFHSVFITGLEEGLFPHEYPGEDDHDPEEERRLFYVAITRARENLFLSYAQSRSIFGRQNINQMSIFLEEILDDLKIDEELDQEEPVKEYLTYD
ncbi:MAG TPA: ATP-dependent DNA helicase PcrA [Candidatus Vogelbacteria bacterium]|nr:ATP-dependent DNA helicase PcrA [Candidatus Vogelbacteria bacterium]